ncbi:MAG: 30S ribosome-binding factor RbfA [Flavobacteriales bacterium]|jgi:ribosome-binding factor A
MSIRQQKIQSLLRRELATIFQRESNILFNGRFITVTHVRITPDLANANVFLSIMASKDVKADLKMIDQNNWKVRKLLGERVGKTMRIIPILTFKIDDSLDLAAQIDELLK